MVIQNTTPKMMDILSKCPKKNKPYKFCKKY